jgi:hypothetical protein
MNVFLKLEIPYRSIPSLHTLDEKTVEVSFDCQISPGGHAHLAKLPL